ncbi:MlaD family protein [Pseudomonas panipatensis]|uniref:Phospholipid/cholesterol/gamma-HCH transport system substrate-binding protein n=1 Tax=Pseudomonas panipatensis TaxID=428992 RepID=A0A1G8BXH9_9PSED|nr:MlaD family protein [Pseudomonas panipatensis]SDH37872.1 phospholipid/cholesterol/gamma-HCH transport system substrate-binding protein [Pseudomonas panipatensis]SMP66852.1 phospholipid/cholesterol/gamma-HCH transport system substrate-binding protein [Pseudomonas panipatensis]
METRAHHVLIGLFTVLVAAGGLLFGLWLAKSSSDQQYNYYDVIFTEAVTGLSQGGTVQYSGIKVGDVVSLRLDPRDPRKVLARIRVFDRTPIRQDTRAKLAITGVTGTAIIQLSNGSPDSPPLLAEDGKVPVIQTIPSPLSKLLANGEDIASNINNLITNVNQLFSQENVDRVGRTLDHIDQATAVIAEQRADIRRTVRELADASQQARQTLANANLLLGNANQLLSSQGKDILGNTQQTLAALQRSSEKIERLLDNNYDAVNGGLKGLGDIGPALRELRSTLESLRGVTRRLQENPANYLLGGDRTKEFQP